MVCEPTCLACPDFCILGAVLGFSLSALALFGMMGFLLSWADQKPVLGPWDFPGKSTGVGCHFLLQGIFPSQGSNPGLPHCRQTLYPLSHQGSPSFSLETTNECTDHITPSSLYYYFLLS